MGTLKGARDGWKVKLKAGAGGLFEAMFGLMNDAKDRQLVQLIEVVKADAAGEGKFEKIDGALY